MWPDTAGTAGRDYYDGPDLQDRVLVALRGAGLDPERLDPDDLAALDEFHALGRAATVALARLAGIAPGDRVIDVGAGIGGPARFLAGTLGASVTAVDPTARFCRLNEALSRGTGLAGRVSVVQAGAERLPFADASFDVGWTQAVSQSVADKSAMFGELARVVRPGGRVAMFEIVAGPGGPLVFPVPWADGPAESHLVAAAELRELLATVGLQPVVWNEGQAALAAIQRAAAEEPPPSGAPDIGLGLVLPDLQARMEGLGRNLADGRIALLQAVLTSDGAGASPAG